MTETSSVISAQITNCTNDRRASEPHRTDTLGAVDGDARWRNEEGAEVNPHRWHPAIRAPALA